jgi:catechol 2,3-dioxygenase-like lactoylglutathione lyase family enzyme
MPSLFTRVPAYVWLVETALQTMVAATYVKDINASRAFYELLGFQERSSGHAATSAWSSLHNGNSQVLLASTKPRLEMPVLPLLFYFFFEDVAAVVSRLQAAGVTIDHVGFPAHASGGELRLADPDGNTVLIGQRERSISQPPLREDEAKSRFSLLREAAAIVAAIGGTRVGCQIRDQHGEPCSNQTEVKLADPSGNSVWACLDHADEILVTVRGAFIAIQDETGIADFLARREDNSA